MSPSATKSERKEFGLVKELYRRGSCVRKGLYESFIVEKPTGTIDQEVPNISSNVDSGLL